MICLISTPVRVMKSNFWTVCFGSSWQKKKIRLVVTNLNICETILEANLWEIPGSLHQFTDKDAENQRDQKAYLRTNQFAWCGIGHPALLSAYEALSKPSLTDEDGSVCLGGQWQLWQSCPHSGSRPCQCVNDAWNGFSSVIAYLPKHRFLFATAIFLFHSIIAHI